MFLRIITTWVFLFLSFVDLKKKKASDFTSKTSLLG